jgi:hypothetical protein
MWSCVKKIARLSYSLTYLLHMSIGFLLAIVSRLEIRLKRSKKWSGIEN